MSEFTANPNATKEAEAVHRELRNRSNDIFKVYNPLSTPFKIKWEGTVFTVPAKGVDSGFGRGCLDVFRYLRDHYLVHMTDHILTMRLDEAVKAENDRRVKAGMSAMNNYEERPAFETKYATNNPDMRSEVIKILDKGMVQKYGDNDALFDGTATPAHISDQDKDFLSGLEGSSTQVASQEQVVNNNDKDLFNV